MNSRASFRKADISRAVAAVKAAGCEVAAVDIAGDGRIRVITTAGAVLTPGPNGELNPWDRTCAAE